MRRINLESVWLRRFVVAGCVAFVTPVLAGTALATTPPLPAGWSHASINVIGPKGKPHTVVYDRGTVSALGTLSLTLTEADGSVVAISVAATANIHIDGQAAALAAVQIGDTATTTAVDGAPAKTVQVKTPPPKPVTTHGKVLAVGSAALTLKEADGAIVTIDVGPATSVRVNGAPGTLAQIQPGATATTTGVPGIAAKRVQATNPPAKPVTTHGKVVAVGPSSLTLKKPNGKTLTVNVASSTKVKVNGQSGSLSQIQPGYTATTVAVSGLPAQRVQSTKPPKKPGGASSTP